MEKPALIAKRKLLEILSPSSVGVEVGVQCGDFSKIILQNTNILRLFMVDAWRHFPSGYEDQANVSDEHHALNLMTATMNTAEYALRRTIIVSSSVSAASLFVDGSLDFVYLDANHSESGVTEDISFWMSKVKSGGILCGDDFMDGVNGWGTVFGVEKAVRTIFPEVNIIEATHAFETPQWWVRI